MYRVHRNYLLESNTARTNDNKLYHTTDIFSEAGYTQRERTSPRICKTPVRYKIIPNALRILTSQ